MASAAGDEPTKSVIGAMITSPGPAAFMLPCQVGSKGRPIPGFPDLDPRKAFSPAYTARAKHEEKEYVRSPGPKYLLEKGIGRHGKHVGAQYSLRMRLKDLHGDPNPGPGKYSPHDPSKTTECNAPAYTMRPKAMNDSVESTTPAANNYKLPPLIAKDITYSTPGLLKSSEKWSMPGRSDHGSFTKQQKGERPGPGAHRPEGSTNFVKFKAPAYSLRTRAYMPTKKTDIPGPKYTVRNQHPKTVRKVAGGSFGMKASPYMHVAIE